MTGEPELLLRQLLAGRDFAVNDLVASQMVNYVYALGDAATGEVVLVDPAWAPSELLELLEAEQLRLTGVLLTHYHADHSGGQLADFPVPGVRQLLELADVPVHVQAPEIEWLVRNAGIDRGALLAHEPDDTLRVGGLELGLLHTPGHTPGSQCILVEGRVITGDTLFLRGCGRTDLPGGDAEGLYESLTRLAALPAETVVYPGHAYDPTPSGEIGELRRSNPVLLPRSAEEWRRRFS
jgi:glyoxylase-like metal-dependent hydrolase (beta-lactamase superfamily II)